MPLLPAPQKSDWRKSKWLTECTGSLPPVVVTGISGDLAWHKSHVLSLIFFAVASIYAVAGCLKAWRAYTEDKKEDDSKPPGAIEGCLYVIHRLICKIYDINDVKNGTVRVVLHRYLPKDAKTGTDAHFEQITKYVGGSGGPINRTTPVYCGLAGKAIRTKQIEFFWRTSEDYGAYRDELVDEFSYSKEQVNELKEDRWSACAVPMFQEGTSDEVIGVLFIDSSEKWMLEDDWGITVLLAACQGLNEYILKRYITNE